MTSANLFRQLKDIQLQADKITRNKIDQNELTFFNNYNEEIKTYLKHHIKDSEVLMYVNEIPDVLGDSNKYAIPILLLITIGILTVGIGAIIAVHVINYQYLKKIQSNIAEARSKYASIEFLLKAKQ